MNVKSGGERWKSIISNDARGYYAYLPALILYHDLTFTKSQAVELNQMPFTHYRLQQKEGAVNKYFIGTAIAQLPFFLLGHAFALTSDYEANGYSKPYAISIAFAAIFYLILGCYHLIHFLKEFSLDNSLNLFATAVIVFGTNLFYYTSIEAGMSHVYSFALIAMLFRFGHKALQIHDTKSILQSAFLLGLIFLIRPVNVLAVFLIPGFFSNPIEIIVTFLKKQPVQLMLAVILVGAISFVQPLIYYFSSGRFFVDSYPGEGFDFLNPHILSFLFSYRKGLFVYAPITFISLFGLIFLWKSSRSQALYIGGVLLFIVYVFSSWKNWWYGGSFGSRPMVEYLPVFSFLLVVFLSKIKKPKLKYAIFTLVLIFSLHAQVQTWQYRKGIIHWEAMNSDKYWDVFMQFSKPNPEIKPIN